MMFFHHSTQRGAAQAGHSSATRGRSGGREKSLTGRDKIDQTPYYSPWYLARNGKFQFRQNMISTERASQEEQNGANFSSVAHSSEELLVSIEIKRNRLTIVDEFCSKMENFAKRTNQH